MSARTRFEYSGAARLSPVAVRMLVDARDRGGYVEVRTSDGDDALAAARDLRQAGLVDLRGVARGGRASVFSYVVTKPGDDAARVLGAA